MTAAQTLYDELIHERGQLSTDVLEAWAELMKPAAEVGGASDEYAILDRIEQASQLRMNDGKEPLPYYDDANGDFGRRVIAYARIGSAIDHCYTQPYDWNGFQQRSNFSESQMQQVLMKLEQIFLEEDFEIVYDDVAVQQELASLGIKFGINHDDITPRPKIDPAHKNPGTDLKPGEFN